MSDSKLPDRLVADFHWPSSGDQIFKETGDSSNTARIDGHARSRLHHMVNGYREAGKLLVEAAVEGRSVKHWLVYPIVHCYRHGLELLLKSILEDYGYHVGQAPNWKDHDLAKLWPLVRQIINHFGMGDDAALPYIEACLYEFSKVDPKSFTFRYHLTQQGQPIAIDLESADLPNLQKTIAGIYEFLECTICEINAQTDAT